ncbi:monofunctional biosynthetic peptidoglycan transglycosylase [Kaistia algarum]|uniref:monofunctional biosynthetic peptidoglycan transglycosylase n=1 Tax=Kaistia algarum TaxID=2083279 RepID=UPI000CE7AD00|nr:monofunctional biosynthetic peptidoglycan transglycosylase [Kaistia algarum]MCX5516687.1 monofunctional biosynthetic peptidoglycan transglycosylase [Kaistia algarum]PPE78584.1 monofunctional biosynthetic peptidoglycan transglycosylase [Kaistia algarum]
MSLSWPTAWTSRLADRRGLAKAALKVLVVIAALPLVLTPVYAFIPPVSTLMLWSALTFQGMDRDWVSFDQIAPAMVASVVMSEDGRFCQHSGVDWQQLNLVLDSKKGPSRGASTIPMQTVKNLFLWQSRSYVRKGLEIPLAYYADFVLTKRRILTIYLNIAEWGPGIFGVEAASRHYFNKSAKDLTARQAALLTAALPNPIDRNPAKPTRFLQSRARTIEGMARQAGDYLGCL